MNDEGPYRIRRSDGSTPSERYLKRLCERTFLSLWSYPRPYRDQGAVGKEVCDLLVVFENHVIIFSDKHCEFPDTGDLPKDWARWFTRAVWTSAQQLYGAERWIKSHANRLFLDSACAERFPIDLPDPSKARFHRVVVAHGVSKRCRKQLGGTGSLMIAPGVIGEAHHKEVPFTIGQIDPARGFVHILDDTTLDIVLTTLDTITDFTQYLEKKQKFIESGRLAWAPGEDDLLGYYLSQINEQEEHDFLFAGEYKEVALDEGFWDAFARSPERERQVAANKISYLWDSVIERFGQNILVYKRYESSHSEVRDQEKLIRFLAREPRLRRRILSRALSELIARSGPTEKAVRVFFPSRRGDPYYVFLLLPKLSGVADHEYRETRMKLLTAYCYAAKLKRPDAEYIVGLAREPGDIVPHSEDLICVDVRELTQEDREEAESLKRDLGLLQHTKLFRRTEKGYPDAAEAQRGSSGELGLRLKGRDRNSPCPCGSGRKYKRCCGRR